MPAIASASLKLIMKSMFGGVGECLFYLMELKDMRYDDVAETIIEFLTKEPVRNGEQNEISESEVSAYFKYS